MSSSTLDHSAVINTIGEVSLKTSMCEVLGQLFTGIVANNTSRPELLGKLVLRNSRKLGAFP